jgi:6,7-dimethyl-8-ribityllumazine synthase
MQRAPAPQVAWVPGSFELPVVAKAMAKSGKYDAVVCIGVVVSSPCCNAPPMWGRVLLHAHPRCTHVALDTRARCPAARRSPPAALPAPRPPQVRGATTHYDAVVGGATSGVLNASTDSGVPVVFGVLTCDTMEQVGGWAPLRAVLY